MRLQRVFHGLVLLCLAALPAQAAHTQARLLLAQTAAHPGQTVMAGIELHMDPGWHTYWKNPGDSGMATDVQWQLPPGFKAGPLEWPAPEKLPDPSLTTYIYQGTIMLLAPITVPADLPPGPVQVKASVSWLECQVSCVPGQMDVQASFDIGAEPKPSPDAAVLTKAAALLPKPATGLAPQAWWEKPSDPNSREMILQWKGTAADADFFPDSSNSYEIESKTERLSAPAGQIRLRKEVKKLAGNWPQAVSGLLIEGAGTNQAAYTAQVPISATAGQTAPASIRPAADNIGPLPQSTLWQMLLYAFLGGLILNVMPCVLPVIALKILGFVAQAKDEPRRVRNLGLIYGLGVLMSFAALAALVIGIKAAGHEAGWGMQFSNPQFVVVLTILVTLVALNLFGLFEVTLSGKVLGAAGTLTRQHGPAGAFFNGVLATILATPCTAPFLGAALGFAFAQTAGIILLIFLTAGAGLAIPYILLSWEPAWLKFLPKPGPWMEKFKVAMGFPMLATAFWLLSLVPVHYGERAWWLGLFLIVLALVAWMFGEFVQRGRSRRGLAALLTAGVLVAGYFGIIEGRLNWRYPSAPQPAGMVESAGNIAWQPWSPEALAAAREQRRPVLVDFTAKWCLTCNTIVKPALENPKVSKKLNQIRAVPLLGDFTTFPDSIKTELKRFARAGVPLVLVYPSDPDEAPMVLPEPSPLLPPSHYSNIVLEYLARATQAR
ncbi:MAG TPA: protein-disulfide reductase DsbD domain-containing protein [Verrucomicrobiae bacterium]|nr:protein-disulfide reductase DsbD domain-containing protein [Verrucomicrobiae bacterium]